MGSTEDDRPEQTLRRKVLTYMIAHPDAKDTVEGIIDWWLADASTSETELSAVLGDLIKRGWVTEASYGQTVIYGFAKSRIEEVRQFLES
ncbi:MAG: hypothetical protein ABSG46_09110 [Candidatus Binataceae bacterium]|jgi:hypothetical protein